MHFLNNDEQKKLEYNEHIIIHVHMDSMWEEDIQCIL